MNLNHRHYLRRLTLPYLLLGMITLLLTACGGGGTDNSTEPPTPTPTPTPTATTKNYSIFLPSEVSTESLSGDIDGIFTSAGTNSLTTKNTKSLPIGIAADGLMTRSSHTSIRDVAGFIVERPALNGESNANQVLDGFESLILSDTNIPSLISTGRQTLPIQGAVLSAYSVTLATAVQPTELSNTLIQYLGVNTINGTVTNLPAAANNEPFETEYTLIIGVIYFSQNEIVVSVVVVPTNIAGTYVHITDSISNSNNIGVKGSTISSTKDTFTAQSGGDKADFLFVIDNSGSMSQEQAAVSSAATAFENAITNSGLDFRIGIITTDSDILRDGYSDGAFTSDITEFATDVIVGINGSFTETGIWFSEQSLLSIAKGDSSDGTVTTAGYPRAGANLSIIIMSDERSQYTQRSGGIAFDVTSNLFLDRGYRVYSMIEPADTNSQYSPLAQITGGSVADIGDTTVFSTIMNNIAINAGAAASQFMLNKTPIAASITVTVNGVTAIRNATNGWTYNTASNSVVFHGTALLSGGETVVVSYNYFEPVTDGGNGKTSPNNSLIEGTWTVAICELHELGSTRNKWTFTSSTSAFVLNTDFYSDSECLSYSATAETATGTFRVGNTITTSTGASGYEFDITSDGTSVTLLGSLIIDSDNILYFSDFDTTERGLLIDYTTPLNKQ